MSAAVASAARLVLPQPAAWSLSPRGGAVGRTVRRGTKVPRRTMNLLRRETLRIFLSICYVFHLCGQQAILEQDMHAIGQRGDAGYPQTAPWGFLLSLSSASRRAVGRCRGEIPCSVNASLWGGCGNSSTLGPVRAFLSAERLRVALKRAVADNGARILYPTRRVGGVCLRLLAPLLHPLLPCPPAFFFFAAPLPTMVALTTFVTPLSFQPRSRRSPPRLALVRTFVGLVAHPASLRAHLPASPAALLPSSVSSITMGLPRRLFSVLFRALVGTRVLNEPVVKALPLAAHDNGRGGGSSSDEDVEDAVGAAAAAAAAAGALRGDILVLHTRYLSEDGSSVDYDGLRSSPEFAAYVDRTRTLGALAPELLTKRQRLVLFMNLYNALTIHAVCVAGASTSSLGRLIWTTRMAYKVGDHVYSLNDMENGVLRGNSRVLIFSPPFGPSDPRRRVALPAAEPLIHMALNCAAASCPPVRYFEEDNVERALEGAASSFLSDDANCAVDTKGRTVHLSAIFSWYAVDFGGGSDEGVLRWVRDHLPEASDKRAELTDLLSSSGAPVRIQINKYDWSLNN